MNDEIREILDNTLEYLERIDETRNTKILTTNETKILLDYITNLQEENERLNNMLNNADNKNLSLIEEINEKQDIIEKAVEYINNFWKEKSYYENIENCLKFATMNEFEKEALLDILQNEKVGDKDE